jgi:hypothetical protein
MLLLCAGLALLCALIACGDGDSGSAGPSDGQAGDSGVTVETTFEAEQEDVSEPTEPHVPDFEPDFNNLTPMPGVGVVTDELRDAADVYPDRIEFPSKMADVSKLSPGSIITSAGSKGAGLNPFGFARRVASVKLEGDRYVVETTNVNITDIIEGDFQVEFTSDNSEDVDMSKLDLEWAANNLYDNDENMILERTVLPADSPPAQVPAGILSSLTSFFKKIGDAVIDAATGTWEQIEHYGNSIYKFITTGTFEESYSYNETIGYEVNSDTSLWPAPDSGLDALPLFSKSFKTKNGTSVKVGLDGKLTYQAGAWLHPGLQVTGKFSVKEEPSIGFNMDSDAGVGVKFDMDVQASVESGGIKSTADKGGLASALKGELKDQLMSGDANSGKAYKYVLFITKPRVKWIQAGPVPVAITMTMQMNLECDFAVQADIKAHADFSQRASFKFGAQLKPSSGGTVTQDPKFTFTRTHEYGFDRMSGNLSAKCGLVPRVNVLLYDSVGVFAGVWGGIHATGSYRDDCGKGGNAVDKAPDAVLDGKLAARVAIQVGGVFQPPGSSTLPDEKRKLLQPDKFTKEVFSKEWPLKEASWRGVGKGLGWCPATCPNGMKEDNETDVDCGGECARKCDTGKKCNRNSECATNFCNKKTGKGICSDDPCGDEVQDAKETDIDCGGPKGSCERCALGKNCISGLDCDSGFCSGPDEETPHVCVKSHCANGVLDGDEGGTDCGGKTCAKCGLGVQVTSAADCASGYINGREGSLVTPPICVKDSCSDGILNGDESAIDCGGSCPYRCGPRLTCNTAADCDPVTAPACHEVTTLTRNVKAKVCAAADGDTCALNVYISGRYTEAVTDPNALCASGVCKEKPSTVEGKTWHICQKPTCDDGILNGKEADVDCGGDCPTACLCGQKCNSVSDCDSLCKECNFGVCGDSATQCSNQAWDPNTETDVDCGGTCPFKCIFGDGCAVDADCELGACTNKFCGIPQGLVGGWPFHLSGQNALGASGPSAAYEGTFTGTSHRGAPVHAADFGGPAATLLETTLGNKLTLAAWIKPRSPVETARNSIIGSANAGAQSEPGFIWFMNSQGTADLSLHFQTGDGTNGADFHTAAGVLKADVWQHVAVVVDRGTKTVSFFVNGLFVAGTGALNEAFTDGLPLTFGATKGGEFALNAYAEEFRIYNIALDGPAVLALKNF